MKPRFLPLIGVIFLISSCKTYTVPVESFRKQMTQPNVEIKNRPVSYSIYRANENQVYETNGIESIFVYNKKGEKTELINSPRLEMRITRKNGKKNILIFDTAIVENDTLKGTKSRIFQNLKKQIALSDIEKIEIQDSGKAFKYQE